MMWGLIFSGVGLTYLEQKNKKNEIDDDVGLNVLRCRADTFGTNNKMRFMMMWGLMSSDVRLIY